MNCQPPRRGSSPNRLVIRRTERTWHRLVVVANGADPGRRTSLRIPHALDVADHPTEVLPEGHRSPGPAFQG
jgi:hypothetical protein